MTDRYPRGPLPGVHDAQDVDTDDDHWGQHGDGDWGEHEDGWHGDDWDGEDWAAHEAAAKRRRRRARGRAFVVLLICLGLVGAAGYIGFDWIRGVVGAISSPTDYPGPGEGDVQVVITPGQTGKEVATTLEQAGVVRTERAFVNAVKADASGSQLQPGTYRLKKKMKAADAYAALIDPASRVSIQIRLREGLWASETFAEIEKQTGFGQQELVAAAKDPAVGLPPEAGGNPEGYLFPATYTFDPGVTPVDIMKAMVAKYTAEMDSAQVPADRRRDILIRASIVQAEASQPADFPKVARVIQNRLDRGQALQFDTTVNFAVGKRGFALTQEDLAVDSPYNTRRYQGLPPGPIGSPGAAAIEAAMAPADGDWIYFVTVNPDTGETVFTSNYNEFLAAKAQFNEWYKNNR